MTSLILGKANAAHNGRDCCTHTHRSYLSNTTIAFQFTQNKFAQLPLYIKTLVVMYLMTDMQIKAVFCEESRIV